MTAAIENLLTSSGHFAIIVSVIINIVISVSGVQLIKVFMEETS